MQGVSKTDFENYVKANDAMLRNMQNQGQGLQNQMTNLTKMLSKFITSNTASSSNKAKKTVQEPNSPEPDSYQPKLPYPERMKMVEDVENENSNVSNSDEPVLLNTPLTDKVESFAPEDEIDEIDTFLAMEVSSNFEEGYFDSEGDENVHANPSSIIESLPVSLIPVEDNDPVQEEIDIFLVPDDLIPPGVENDDSEDEDNSTFLPENESSILEPSSPRPPPGKLDRPNFSKDSRVRCFVPVHSSFLAFVCN
ncbi:hypothetical protein Tco_0167728 [Tanacetum coccineum]